MENEYRVSAADNQPIVFGGQVRSELLEAKQALRQEQASK